MVTKASPTNCCTRRAKTHAREQWRWVARRGRMIVFRADAMAIHHAHAAHEYCTIRHRTVHIRSIFRVAVSSSRAGRSIAVRCQSSRAVPFTSARRITQRTSFRHRMSVPFVTATASHEQSRSHEASHSSALHACQVQMQQSSQAHLAAQQCVQPDRPKACAFGSHRAHAVPSG
jgi:hypothetical protein